MNLTTQQEAFCQQIADGKSQADAYRFAYPKSLNWKPEAVYSQASTLMSGSKVAKRVDELRAVIADKCLWTREQSVKVLAGIAGEGANNEKVSAVKELNSMHGFNAPIKIDATIKTLSQELLELNAIANTASR